MKQTAGPLKSKLLIKKNIVAKFNNLTKNNVKNHSGTLPTTITSIVKTAVF